MAFKRFIKDVVLYFDSTAGGGPDEYLCGYEYPNVYTLEVGNPQGSEVIDARWEYAPWQPPPQNIQPPFVDVVDETHVSLACKVGSDVGSERVKVRIISLVSL
jgi:hypothetical protein